jgi:KaiC/GvpD/RAD55 family RecA-like ATPase
LSKFGTECILIILLLSIAPSLLHSDTASQIMHSSQADCSNQLGQVTGWRNVTDGPNDFVTVDTFKEVGSVGQPYVDLANFSYGFSDICVYFRFGLFGVIPNPSAAPPHVQGIWYDVLLDTNSASGIGLQWGSGVSIRYYLHLEIGFQPGNVPDFSVAKYSGTGTDWKWTLVAGTERLGENSTLSGGIGANYFIIGCRDQDIEAGNGSTIRFFARSGIRFDDGGGFNDYAPNAGILSLTLPATNTQITSLAASSMQFTSVQTMASSTSSAATEAALANPPLLVAGAMFSVVAVVAGILLMRRKKPTETQRLQRLVEHAAVPSQGGISTGCSELDQLLAGGLPEGFSILFLSASWDERDLLLRRMIKSCISTSRPVFYVSTDITTTQELVNQYSKEFYAFSDQVDKIKPEHGNLFRIPGFGNLSDFTISLGIALKDTHVAPEVSKVLVFDMISQILLRHKSSVTLRWLSEFVAKRKTENFTIIATLNPLIAPKEESQPIIDLFDGVIQIYEKELAERARRFIVIRKMRGRRYIETDLMLDRNKLFF